MDFDRYCTEIVTQTELLTAGIKDADLRARVPSCPDWSLGDLVRHIGHGHRWAAETVRTRTTEFLPDDDMRDLAGDDTVEPPVDWLQAGAVLLADTLRTAGPDVRLWAPFHYDTTAFYARRFTHETVMHRADATLAAGAGFDLAADVAVDALDEWAELGAVPELLDIRPAKRELLGPGHTVALAATDAPHTWFVDCTGDAITWRRAAAPAAVTVHGTLVELLFLVYRRRPVDGLAVSGDRAWLDFWLGHMAFG